MVPAIMIEDTGAIVTTENTIAVITEMGVMDIMTEGIIKTDNTSFLFTSSFLVYPFAPSKNTLLS